MRIPMDWYRNKFEDRIENGGKTYWDVGGKTTENAVATRLQEKVLATGAAVGVRVGERWGVIEEDSETVGGVEEVHFHVGVADKGDG